MNCGAVVEERALSTEPSKKMFLDAEKGLGPGLTHLLHDQGVGTIKTGRYSPPREKLLSHLLGEIVWISDKLGLPKVVAEKAGELGRRAVAQGLFKRARKASAAATVYVAAKQYGLGKTLREVATASDIPLSMLNHEISKIVFELKVKVRPINYELLITRIGRILNLQPEIVEEACTISRNSRLTNNLMGRRPSAVSSAILYMVCRRNGLKIPFTRIAEAAGVSSTTLRKTVDHLKSLMTENS